MSWYLFNQIQQGIWVIKVTSLMNLNSILQDSLFNDQQVIIYPGIIFIYHNLCKSDVDIRNTEINETLRLPLIIFK